jgi:hypothetical protein
MSVLLNSALAHQLEIPLEPSSAGINPALHPLMLAQPESPALSLDKFSVKASASIMLYNANNQLNVTAPCLWDVLMALALTRLAIVLKRLFVEQMKLFATTAAAKSTVVFLLLHPPGWEECSMLLTAAPTTVNTSVHQAILSHRSTTVLQLLSAVPTRFNAQMAHASTTSLNVLRELALLAMWHVGMDHARLLLAIAQQESAALMSFQLSALMVLARALPLLAPNTSNVQFTSHTDAVQANADHEARIARLWSPAHLKCQLNARTKVASDQSSNVALLQQTHAPLELTTALTAHALLLNLSAQLSLRAQLVKSDAGTTTARTTLHFAQLSQTTHWFAQLPLLSVVLTVRAETHLLTVQLQVSALLNSQFSVTTETAVNPLKLASPTLAATSELRDVLMALASEPPILAVHQ